MLVLLGKLSRLVDGVVPEMLCIGERARIEESPNVGVAGTVARAAR